MGVDSEIYRYNDIVKSIKMHFTARIIYFSCSYGGCKVGTVELEIKI
jgi:hypothetical protein